MRDPSPPSYRFQVVHAGLLCGGLLVGGVALAWQRPEAGAVAGLLISASGAMTVAGCRITFAGALGTMLREVLGGRRVKWIQARGWVVIVLGLALAGALLWWASEAPTEPEPQPPGLPIGRSGL